MDEPNAQQPGGVPAATFTLRGERLVPIPAAPRRVTTLAFAGVHEAAPTCPSGAGSVAGIPCICGRVGRRRVAARVVEPFEKTLPDHSAAQYRRAMRRAWFGMLMACTSASCMFFRSLDDLSAERGGAMAADDAEGGADAARDGTAQEASNDDAPFDGESGAGRTSPCVPGHTFALCADFDVGDIADGFDGVDKGSAGALELSTMQAASAPRSAYAENPSRASGQPELRNAITLEKSGVFGRAVLELDLFVAGVDQNTTTVGGAGLAVILFRSDSVTTGTVLALGATNTSLSVENTDSSLTDYFGTPPITVGKWVHVLLDFRTSGTFDYSVDGQTGQRTFAAVTLTGSSPRISLSLGLHTFNSPSIGVAAYYDNVTLRLE